jgi:thiamine-phosphate pyrophosphorylase
MVQLRDKRLSDRELIQRAGRLMELARDTPTLVIINDRVDIVQAVSAHGVHLGQDDLPLADARRLLGPDVLIGVSTHSMEQARQAVVQGASYIGVGPTFASATKQFHEFPGPPLLRAVAAEIRLPSFAIGGIGLEQLDEVLACGIWRVAVSSAVWGAASPEVACRAFVERLAASPAMEVAPQPSGTESHEP